MSSTHQNVWLDRNMWDAESPAHLQMELASVMSFASSSGGGQLDQLLISPDQSRRSSQQLEAKVDMVYSLLAMLGGQEHADMGETLLALSTNPESCLAMRQSGCLPLLVQLVQSDRDSETRKKAAEALRNLVHAQLDEKLRKRETRILGLLETVSGYTESLENNTEFISNNRPEEVDKHPIQAVSQMMKFSFDEGYRQAICQLGGIHFIAKLVEMEHLIHGGVTEEINCNLLRRHACMILTNLTFGDSGNKALLCSYKDFIRALVVQLQTSNDDLRQATASVLRNLSWRADSTSKEILKEVGSVKGLMKVAMRDNKENTLISILSALWNLSAHCTENKAEICSVNGALLFLVQMLSYKSSSESLAVIEHSGGILRNISSQIASQEDYRNILRTHNCLQILIDQLKSSNLTVVSNACGTLWNLSSDNSVDQELLRTLGAPSMLRSLNNSKHKMIAMGSTATLKNLLNPHQNQPKLDSAQPLDLSVDAGKQTMSSKSSGNCLSGTTIVDSPLDLSKKRNDIFPIVKKVHDIKSSSFASLNTNEPSINFSNEKRSRMLQSCGSSSLPYVNSTISGGLNSCVPVRKKYSANYEEEVVSSEEPFDFSRRYSETRPANNVSKNKTPNGTARKFEKPKNENENFSIYAETDLDQPTDYSLRYAEDDSDSDSDVCDNVEKTPAEFVGDTVKTYCTEGTPYETPCNFSTSTSMSDLRIADKNVANDKEEEKKIKSEEVLLNNKEKEHCLPKLNSESETHKPQTSKIKSEFSSGLVSPEKPMNYCEEGTPGYFSRVSSFGSLNTGEEKVSFDKDKCSSEAVSPKEHKNQQKPSTSEVKVVKFENNVNYCEETPLMFSRSSSLGSLGSIEQHSIHDDRSSVISDFSRLTSGIISPSELPDSPIQTVPPSPKPQKPPDFPIIDRRTSADGRPQLSVRTSLPKSSVFEDGVRKFKEESTPIQYSMTTSLSSLTIDDQEEAQVRESVEESGSIREDLRRKLGAGMDNKGSTQDEESDVSEFSRGGVRSTLQGKRLPQLSRSGSGQHMSSFRTPYSTAIGASVSSITPTLLPPPLPVDNTVYTYCTEDTPAVLSHNGSVSDLSLSTLSMLDEEPESNRVYLTENSSESSERDENIVVEGNQSEVLQIRQQNENVWVRREESTISERRLAEGNINTLPYITVRDEVSRFAVEDSPMQFSLRSSLSSLTINSSMASGTKDFSPRKPTSPEPSLGREPPENHPKEYSYVSTEKLHTTNLREQLALPEEDDISTIASSSHAASSKECNAVNEEEEKQSSDCLTNETDSVSLDKPFRNLELNCGDITPYGSLKKRRWKWKWKFTSDGSEQSSSTDGLQLAECQSDKDVLNKSMVGESSKESVADSLYTRSLDASFKKKRWWKWKFGSKETEQPTCSSSTNVPETEEVDTGNTSGTSKEAPLPSEDESSYFKRAGSSFDTRSKSKRWKWKWKFSSKESEPGRSDESISLGLSKLKDTVSPRESFIVGGLLEPAALDSTRPSTSGGSPSKMLSRSASEPRSSKKRLEETEPRKFARKSSVSSLNSLVDICKLSVKNEAVTVNDTESIRINSTEDISADRRRLLEGEENCAKSLPPYMPSTQMFTSKDSASEIGNAEQGTQNKTDYDALVKECMLLGMPKKQNISEEEDSPAESILLSTSRSSPEKTNKSLLEMGSINNQSSNNLSGNVSVDHMAILEECIQLGMPKKDVSSKMTNNHALDYLDTAPSSPQKGALVKQNDLIDQAVADKYLELAKKVQKPKDKIMSRISRALSFDKPPKPSTSKDSDTSLLGRAIAGKILPPRSCSNKIGKNDLEFLKRQLNIIDKHLLQEAIERGISKEEEALLVETLIVSRVMGEAKRAEEAKVYSSIQASLPSKRSQRPDNLASSKDESMIYPEETLDPVTLSIVKRILHHRFAKEEGNIDSVLDDMELEEAEVYADVQDKDCDFEIVLEERIKVTLSKNEEVSRGGGVVSSSSRNMVATRSPSKGSINNDFLARLALMSGGVIETSNEKANFGESRQLGCSNRKGETQEYADSLTESLHQSPSKRAADSNMSRTLNSKASTSKFQIDNVDADLLVQERIHLGMPKSAVRSSSNAKINEITVKSGRSSSLDGNTNYAALVEECIQLGMPKKKEPSEEALYANISLSPGYSRSNSMSRQKELTAKKTYSRDGRSVSPKKTISNACFPDPKALIEECITMGIPNKHESGIRNIFSKGLEEKPHCSTASLQSNDKPDYSALLEECIGLGMPRKTDAPTDARSCLQKTAASNMISSQSASLTSLPKKTQPDCTVSDEEAIYANVSTAAGYSRPDGVNRVKESPAKYARHVPEKTVRRDLAPISIPKGAGVKKQDYSALVEECIQLGMPVKQKMETFPQGPDPKEALDKKQNYEALIEECIQLGMPKKQEFQDEVIYANTTERYSTFPGSTQSDTGLIKSLPKKVVRTEPELGSSRIPFENSGINRVGGSLVSMDKALEECIQLGWSKKKELIPVTRNVDLNSFSESSKVILSDRPRDQESKNVDVASVARNTPEPLRVCFKLPTMATGAEGDSRLQGVTSTTEPLDIEERLWADLEKNGYSENLNCSFMDESLLSDTEVKQIEMSFGSSVEVDKKLLDPEAMLESLDRYTAELVSQAELRLQYKDCSYKNTNCDNLIESRKAVEKKASSDNSNNLKHKVVSFKTNDTEL